ncbi:hypothetical protein SAMN02745136_02927 [Anaerocolumna jejuensis DSM 15929]|uniref:Uncharacterized protein n=1 Tax=Anaerocolumna jejuensis DSM 15929 TaxID=1121322 RepID=A0A1M6TYQ4_9FIRM|nr:hypothetical protein [Anaerocolumna jejuensis]SHK62155.1 hypothetical protein SAMN02745136_02927 [Anaerocolumna jejuensis DSM 15929]
MEKDSKQTNNSKVTSKEEPKKPEDKYGQTRDITVGSAMVHKAAYEPQSECNPDNGAFFEERSNPLSSKGN